MKNMLHLNHCFIISQCQHVKNLVLHYFSNLRYFGQREGIFCFRDNGWFPWQRGTILIFFLLLTFLKPSI